MLNDGITPEHASDLKRPNIGYWLWRTVMSKIWWSATATHWAAMIASLYFESLKRVYNTAFSGFATVLFFPPLVALILSFGYLKACIGPRTFDDSADLEDHFEQQRDWYGPSGMLMEFDPLDPASGALWVGNPLNPLNGAYINRHPS